MSGKTSLLRRVSSVALLTVGTIGLLLTPLLAFIAAMSAFGGPHAQAANTRMAVGVGLFSLLAVVCGIALRRKKGEGQ